MLMRLALVTTARTAAVMRLVSLAMAEPPKRRVRLCTRMAHQEGVSRIPGERTSRETLISRRVRETRIGLPKPAVASVSGESHPTAGFGTLKEFTESRWLRS